MNPYIRPLRRREMVAVFALTAALVLGIALLFLLRTGLFLVIVLMPAVLLLFGLLHYLLWGRTQTKADGAHRTTVDEDHTEAR